MLDQQLKVPPRLIQADLGSHEDSLAFFGDEGNTGVALAEHGTADLCIAIFQREIPVSRGRSGEVGELPLEPNRGHSMLQ